MVYSNWPTRALKAYTRNRKLKICAFVSVVLVILGLLCSRSSSANSVEFSRAQYPRLWQTVIETSGHGGRWYIPPSWLAAASDLPAGLRRDPTTTLEAAELAFYLVRSQLHTINGSSIPLIVHQTIASTDPHVWTSPVQQFVESWLALCHGQNISTAADEHKSEMAYILWDDDGVKEMMMKYEQKTFLNSYDAMPLPVERVDIFRVAVLRWFGGVYSDIDTKPLRHPATWIEPLDIQPWDDKLDGRSYSLSKSSQTIYPAPKDSQPLYLELYDLSSHRKPTSGPGLVGAIVGIETDLPPDRDDYWRAGYGFPLQITQWTIALAPHHPLAVKYLSSVADDTRRLTEAGGLQIAYAVDLTGPVQFTTVIRTWLEAETGLRWDALSGRYDGGRSKAVLDILILPITGFSPGRKWWPMMGSKNTSDPSARIYHAFQGSWRGGFDWKVEYGKICRSVFGRCRSWSKSPVYYNSA
ncbi:hypothetical protein V1525DRAFT_347693 [Lipomyces kononenkoae]|uniref:Uncharacterized protein n=1 Tax=Lipomyces kononenkoae TaxID=34357 RepID=A0ACC3SVS0_LIPKO